MRSHLVLNLVAIVSISLTFSIMGLRAGADDPPKYSFSLKEARERKTLIARVRMVPETAKWGDVEVTVGDAWLEARKNGGCYLCFRIDKGKRAMGNPLKFVADDSGTGVMLHTGFGVKWVQGVQYLDAPENLSEVRFSLVRYMTDQRLKNIRFDITPARK